MSKYSTRLIQQNRKKGEDGYDPLYKVRPLVQKLSETFEKYYSPGLELVIDEMMIGTRCCIHFLLYIPKSLPNGT